METITVNTVPSYNVCIKSGLTDRAGEEVRKLVDSEKIMVVTDENVFALYEKKLLASLRAQGFTCCAYIIAPGERSKTPSKLLGIWNALAENGFTRSDTLLSYGGGVVSDLGGFAAATYMRGMKHIIFPTTLLAMSDASVGGKNAVDLTYGKNMAGTFYAPKAVFCDTAVLDTLPENVYCEGMAEIIKCGMICSEELLFAAHGAPSNEKLIAQAVKVKKTYVEQDEKDVGARHMLNFGHTLAHAAETLSEGRMPHGKAVAAGMYVMTEAAVKNGLCTPVTLDVLNKILDIYKLPKSFPFSVRELCAAALNDKKRAGNTITLVIPTGLGRAELFDIAADKLFAFLSV